nr:heterogeneous nuclear ribonucleoprotein Q-like [Tanacetum cinerariifolium]
MRPGPPTARMHGSQPQLVAGGGGPGHHYGKPRGGPSGGSNRYLGGNPSGGGYNPHPSRGGSTALQYIRALSELKSRVVCYFTATMYDHIVTRTQKHIFYSYALILGIKMDVRKLCFLFKGKQCGVALSQDRDTLFVGNICKRWSKDMLKEKLARYGIDKFVELALVEDAKSVGMNRGFSFLDFPTRPDTLEACRRLQKRDVIFGTDWTARIAFADTLIEPDDEVMAHVRTVFVDGLTTSWEADIINDHLRQFGKKKVEVARNMPAAKRDDFGFITFSTHESAVSCVHVGGDSHGSYSSWEGGSNRIDSHRFTDRGRRSIRDHSPYDGGRRRSFDSRDERGHDVLISDRLDEVRWGDREEYIRKNVGRPSSERQLNRDSYTSRGAGYMEDSSRTVSRVSGRGTSHMYDEDDQKRRKKLKCY